MFAIGTVELPDGWEEYPERARQDGDPDSIGVPLVCCWRYGGFKAFIDIVEDHDEDPAPLTIRLFTDSTSPNDSAKEIRHADTYESAIKAAYLLAQARSEGAWGPHGRTGREAA